MAVTRMESHGLQKSIRFFVDLDETLVHSSLPTSRNSLEQISLGQYVSTLRPGARGLLSTLSQISHVWLCTAADRTYASEVLDGFGLTHYFSGMIARHNLNSKTRVKHKIDRAYLIDDLPKDHVNIKLKLNTIGVRDCRLVRVTPFHGDPADFELFATTEWLLAETKF